MPEPLIRVDRLVKTFRTYDRRPGISGALLDLVHREYKTLTAVDRIGFEIERGEMVGYIGANGAGKSTTIKILAGILFPTSGEVTVDGLTPWKNREAHVRRIGAVFGQRSQLWWDLAAGESLRLLAKIYGVTAAQYAERMREFERVLELDAFIKTPVRKLSLGQKMRCELAAALLHQPPVLFLDEPTIGLDVVAKQSIREFLKTINQTRGVTTILTTHDLREIEELCSRVIIIDNGRILFDGSLKTLRKEMVETLEVRFRLAHTLPGDWWPEHLPREGIVWQAQQAELVSKLTRSAQSRTEVIRAVLDRMGSEVLDISIEEPEIEEIVRRIYRSSRDETVLNIDGLKKKMREGH